MVKNIILKTKEFVRVCTGAVQEVKNNKVYRAVSVVITFVSYVIILKSLIEFFDDYEIQKKIDAGTATEAEIARQNARIDRAVKKLS